MSWKDTLSFFKVAGCPHRVNGVEVIFYPLSTAILLQCESVGKDVVSAFAELFQNTSHDHAATVRKFNDGDEVISEAIAPETIRLRSEQRVRAVEKIFNNLSSKKTQELVANIIMDSMKESFPNKRDWPPCDELLGAMPLPVFVDIMFGVAKANKGTFDPFVTALGLPPVSQLVQSLVSRIQVPQEDSKPEPTPTENPLPKPPTTDGKSFAP